MANKTIYAYSSNNIWVVYDITATRNGSSAVITVTGTINYSSTVSSSDANRNLYAHVCYDVSPANTSTATRYVSSYGTSFGTGVLIKSAPLNVSNISNGESFTASWTVTNPASSYSNVALFLSKSASSPSDSSGNAWAFVGKRSTSISESHVRYVTQSLSLPATYTVSYNKGANGTGTNTTDTKTEDVALTLKGAIFTRTGYTQTGWSTTDGSAKTYDLGGSYTANAAVTLYPFWTINTYTVSYDKGSSGTGTNTTDTKTYGVALTLKGAIFTRTNYMQSGWATSDGGAKVYELGGSYTTNAAVTLYPVWADPASIMIKVNGTWVKGEPYVKVNGTWVKGTAYIKVDGVWKQGV